MVQYGVLGACQPYSDFRNATYGQVGCPEASRSQNRGQK